MITDIRNAFRLLGRNPGFAAAAILTIAFAMRATTTISSVFSVLVVSLVALGASLVPARRAAKADPLTILR